MARLADLALASSTTGLSFIATDSISADYRVLATDIIVQAWGAGGSFSRASDSSFSVADNATNQENFKKGRAIRYRATAGTWRYGQVTDYATGTVTIHGYPMTTSDDDEIQYDTNNNKVIVLEPILLTGEWADGVSTTLLFSDLLMKNGLVWLHSQSYLVGVQATVTAVDTGANQPRVNVTVGGNAVCTANSNAGVQPTTSGVTFGTSIGANYSVPFGSLLEVTTDANGSNKDSKNLKLDLIFVKE